MAKKKSFVLRINPETYKIIEKWASDEFRSVNGQIEWIIDQGIRNAKRQNDKKQNDDSDTESS